VQTNKEIATRLEEIARALRAGTRSPENIAARLRKLAAELAATKPRKWQAENRWNYPSNMGRGDVIEKGSDVYERKLKVNQLSRD
jgi:hypothetical protein